MSERNDHEHSADQEPAEPGQPDLKHRDELLRRPGLDDRLRALGFERHGREWVLPRSEIAFEAPDEMLAPGDEAEWAELSSGRRIRILSLEDMLLWRLREWVFWHHPSGFQQAAHLLVSHQLDAQRLDQRADDEGLGIAVSELRRLTAEIEAGRTLTSWEISQSGKNVERSIYTDRDD